MPSCEIDWKIVIGLFSTGSLMGSLLTYWIKSKIDNRNTERQWKRQYCFNDLKTQRELLFDFLGTHKSEFETLHCFGNTWDEALRRNKAQPVIEWVERYRPRFPEDVHRSLNKIAYIARSMILDQDQKIVQQDSMYRDVERSFNVIKGYVERIEKELKGM